MEVKEANQVVEQLEKRIEETIGSMKRSLEIAKETNTDIIKGLNEKEDIKELRQLRQESQQDAEDYLALLDHLKIELETAKKDVIEAQKQEALGEYKNMALKRSAVNRRIEIGTERLVADLEELVKIDMMQREKGNEAQIRLGRSAQKLIEDYLTEMLKPYLPGLIMFIRKGKISDNDSMALEKEDIG